MKYLKAKRVIDLVLSVLAAVILSPVLLILFIAIKLDTPGPIFFKQKRVGINKTHFNILKFRTMRIDTPKDTPTHLLGNPDQYITKVGKFLRKTSLDELPQIFNIIKGEMAIIGPRPALWNQYDVSMLKGQAPQYIVGEEIAHTIYCIYSSFYHNRGRREYSERIKRL